MTVEPPKPHELRGAAKLAAKLREVFQQGLATRPAFEVDNLWAICRACESYREDRCQELELADGMQVAGEDDRTRPTYVELLTRAEFFCRRWSAAVERPRRLPATSTTEAALARLHQLGVTRTKMERKATRNAARRDARTRRR